MSQETVIRCDGKIEEVACATFKVLDRGLATALAIDGFDDLGVEEEWLTVIVRPEEGNRAYQFCPACSIGAARAVASLLSKETIERERKIEAMQDRAYGIPMRIRRARRGGL